MNISKLIIKIIIVTALQVLILKRMDFAIPPYFSFQIFLYPILFTLVPLNFSRTFLLLFAAVYGLLIDMFYDSPGLHVAVCVFTAFMKKYILMWLEPRGGYKTAFTYPSIMGYQWFSRLVLGLFIPHILIYCFLDAFTFNYFFITFSKFILSTIASLVFVIMYIIIFNPRK